MKFGLRASSRAVSQPLKEKNVREKIERIKAVLEKVP